MRIIMQLWHIPIHTYIHVDIHIYKQKVMWQSCDALFYKDTDVYRCIHIHKYKSSRNAILDDAAPTYLWSLCALEIGARLLLPCRGDTEERGETWCCWARASFWFKVSVWNSSTVDEACVCMQHIGHVSCGMYVYTCTHMHVTYTGISRPFNQSRPGLPASVSHLPACVHMQDATY